MNKETRQRPKNVVDFEFQVLELALVQKLGVLHICTVADISQLLDDEPALQQFSFDDLLLIGNSVLEVLNILLVRFDVLSCFLDFFFKVALLFIELGDLQSHSRYLLKWIFKSLFSLD